MGVITRSVLNTSGTLTAREKDFVFQFETQWDLLRTILGIVRPIKKEAGTSLAYYTAERVGNLNGPATEGQATTPTEYQVKKAGTYDLELERYEKAVTADAVQKYGSALAIEMTDKEFLSDLQLVVMNRFYEFLKLGTLVGEQSTWQRCIAIAQGSVINRAAAVHKTVNGLVGFIGIMDLYDYLGDKEITIQTAFGLQYVKDFLGFKVLFLLPSTVLDGKVICTPINNMIDYYVDPSNEDFKKLGLDYTVTGETNLIGVHMDADYKYGTGSTFALMGFTLFAERIDLISVITLNKSANNDDPAVVAGSAMETGSPAEGISNGKRKG